MISNIRAWHKRQKRMIMMYDIVSIDFDRQEITEKEVFFDNEGIPDDRELIDYDFIELEIMQSIGALDKNGLEIYEGDILEYEDDVYRPFKGCVEWDAGYAHFRLVNKDSEYKKSMPLLGSLLKRYATILGNKYENPELLKEDE